MKINVNDTVRQHPGLFFQRKNGKFLVIEPSNFKWGVVDKGLKNLLDFIEVEKSVKSTQNYGLSLADVEELYTAGFVQINNKPKYRIDFHDKNTRKELSLIILHTSNMCNFRCTYCYTDSSCYTGTSTANLMDFSVAKCAMDQVVQLHDGSVEIQFHGGEPLLNYKLIKAVVDYGSQFCRGDGSNKFNYSIVTNLSLIDEEIADYFVENEVRIGFSIDGPRQFNDRARVYKDGKSTFEDVMRGLKLLQKKGIPVDAHVVVSDISVIDHLYDFMIDTGIKSLKLVEYTQQGRAKSTMPVQTLQKEYAYKLLRLTDTLIKHNARSETRLKIREISFMLHPVLGAEMPSLCMKCPCGAGLSLIGIDVDGSVFPCKAMRGKKELSVGNITQDSLVDMLASPTVRLLKARTAEEMQDCSKCEIRNICSVGCPKESYNQTGGFDQKTKKCAFFKVIYPELMWRVYEHRDSILTLV